MCGMDEPAHFLAAEKLEKDGEIDSGRGLSETIRKNSVPRLAERPLINHDHGYSVRNNDPGQKSTFRRPAG